MVCDKGMNDLYKHLWNIWILLINNKDVIENSPYENRFPNSHKCTCYVLLTHFLPLRYAANAVHHVLIDGLTGDALISLECVLFGRSEWPRGLRHKMSSRARTQGS
jgi:hypothetical protein